MKIPKDNIETKIPLFNRVSVQFVSFVILLTLLSGGVIPFVTINISRNSIRQEVLNNNLTKATVVAEFTSNYIEVIQGNVESFASRPLISLYIEENDLKSATKMLVEFVQIQTVLDTCGLYSSNGIQLTLSNPDATTIGQSFADRDWFQQTIATRKPYQSVPLKSRATGNAVVAYAVPILNEQDQIIGVFAGAISLLKLSDVIANISENNETNYSIIDTRNGGLILANEDPQLILSAVASEEKDTIKFISNSESGSFETTNGTEEKELVGYAPIPNLPWGVIVSTNSTAAFSVIDQLTQTASILTIILVFIASVLGGLFVLQITTPIRRLVEDTKVIGKGNLEHKIKTTGKGEIAQLAHSFVDMTGSLKKIMVSNETLERRVKERTSQLESTNKEIESFSYSVSHDLQAPLRHISGFVELLRNHLNGNLDDKSQHYLKTISYSTKEMGHLIDDLLSFLRTGKTDIKNDIIDLNIIVKDTIAAYQPEVKSKNINWYIADLPTVRGDINMIKLVFDNLISNALKFTRLNESPMIEIGSEPDLSNRDHVVIYIKDNGVGFDMQYKDKLFGVFQRLHSKKVFEGNGIGLANVKRIILKHGGRVWADGAVGDGAVFSFTIPKYHKNME